MAYYLINDDIYTILSIFYGYIPIRDGETAKDKIKNYKYFAIYMHTPLRVALITANYYNNIDGVSLTINRLVSYLLKKGSSVMYSLPL